MIKCDTAIIGGGIIGLATAYQLSHRFPDQRIVVLEKEAEVARHQTGNNSGVLHSGIYYKPGSLKAENCRDGRTAMIEFCRKHEVEFEVCGKVIVAVEEAELPALKNIFERGQANGVNCQIIDKERLAELEPHSAGISAIHVPDAGIVNYRQVCQRMADEIQNQGEVRTGARVTKIEHRGARSTIETTNGEIDCGLIVNCGGLYCDRLAKLGGMKPEAKIVPFRGEYYEVRPEKQHLCRNLIYPVPDPKFPFLGVHFTRMVEGGVECGPNAVLAFAREGYTKRQFNIRDLFESLTYPGFIRMAMKHWRMGFGEMWRSLSKRAFVKALQRLMPEITEDDLVPGPAGIRAQALLPNGQLVDDFLILESEPMITINNAPSPGATASLNIGKLIVEKIAARR